MVIRGRRRGQQELPAAWDALRPGEVRGHQNSPTLPPTNPREVRGHQKPPTPPPARPGEVRGQQNPPPPPARPGKVRRHQNPPTTPQTGPRSQGTPETPPPRPQPGPGRSGDTRTPHPQQSWEKRPGGRGLAGVQAPGDGRLGSGLLPGQAGDSQRPLPEARGHLLPGSNVAPAPPPDLHFRGGPVTTQGLGGTQGHSWMWAGKPLLSPGLPSSTNSSRLSPKENLLPSSNGGPFTTYIVL